MMRKPRTCRWQTSRASPAAPWSWSTRPRPGRPDGCVQQAPPFVRKKDWHYSERTVATHACLAVCHRIGREELAELHPRQAGGAAWLARAYSFGGSAMALAYDSRRAERW